MKFKFSVTFFFFISACLFLTTSCDNTTKTDLNNIVKIGIPSDIKSLNPMYAINLQEGQINEQIFCPLLTFEWDEEIKNIVPVAMLAESWQWNSDSNVVTVLLKENLFWSDSVKITTEDIIFTYDIYSDPVSQSRFYGSFENFYLNENLSINLEKTLGVVSEREIKFSITNESLPNLINLDLPILPKHIYGGIKREELPNSEINFSPIGSGAFKLKLWERNQVIILEKSNSSFLALQTELDGLVFKIIPNYNSSLLQLKSGEIDILSDVKPLDVAEVITNTNLSVKVVEGRAYDFIGWNNIDPKIFAAENKLESHELFGNSEIRKALTLAIDRKMIVDEFLGEYGRVANGPISDIFGYELDKMETIKSYAPELAKQILQEEGWADSDNDGIRDKNGCKFQFDLSIPGGNPLRKVTAKIIKNNLAAVGIIAEIRSVEPSIFFDKLFKRELDAAIAGWSVPIPLDLTPYWHSSQEKGIANIVTYQNKNVDSILGLFNTAILFDDKKQIVENFQHEMITNPPVTFLFWQNTVVVYNNRVENFTVNPLGNLQFCWKWEITN